MTMTHPNEDRSALLRAEVRHAIDRARMAEVDEQVAAVARAVVRLDAVTTEAHFDLEAPAHLQVRGEPHLLNRVQMRCTRFIGATHGDDDRIGSITIQGYVQPLKADGTPDMRKTQFWTYLPDELTALLAPAVLTQG